MIFLINYLFYSNARYISGALEPQFYAILIEKLNLEIEDLPDQSDKESWPSMKIKFKEIFLGKTQLEWTNVFDGSDACVTPVLSFHDPIPNSTPTINENQWPRQAALPQPAPLLSRTPALKAETRDDPFMKAGKHSIEILKEYGIDSDDINQLLKSGVVIDSSSSSSRL